MINKQKFSPDLNNIIKGSEEYKTINYISRSSINSIHIALRNLTGENSDIFEKRFKILHAMCTKALKPFLKLEDIHRITKIPIQNLSNHLQSLKECDLLNNKGGQYWRVTSKGRRLLDNITILLFENSGDFDDIDLINASLTHLNLFTKHYGLDLKINSRIIRYFDYIISEIEDQPIELLSPENTLKIRHLLKKIDSFYNHLRVQIYQSNKIEPDDTWNILDKLAKRHNIVGNTMLKLDKHITTISAHIDIHEALSYYLGHINPKNVIENYGIFFKFNLLNISSEIESRNLIKQMKNVVFYERIQKPPNYDSIPYQLMNKGLHIEESEEDIEILKLELKKIAKEKIIRIKDIIDLDDWEGSVVKLVLIARLSSSGDITLSNNKFLNFKEKEVKLLLDSEVILNF